jgi:hypothetical protein
MRATLSTAGETVLIECLVAWVSELLEEAFGSELRREGGRSSAHRNGWSPTVEIVVERAGAPFATGGFDVVTRSAYARGSELIVHDLLSSGFDLLVRTDGEVPRFTYRWRPRARNRAAARAFRSRFHLLARAALVQYPAMWSAGLRGRAPLHASVLTAGTATPLLAGPGGVGKSTLLMAELENGGKAVSDNVSVSDGLTVWGLVEPLRVEGGAGRRMPFGRSETPMPGRVGALVPDRVIVVRRGGGDSAELRTCPPDVAARALVAGTYMAGELRRYWGLAATVAAAAGLGPVHPPVEGVAQELCHRLPCAELLLPRQPGVARLAEALSGEEARR